MSKLVESTNPPWQTVVSPGVSPGFIFSRQGTLNAGGFLAVGQVVSDTAGQPIFGNNRLVRMRLTNKTNVSGDTVVGLCYRTGVSTREDIVGATITIPTGSFEASIELDIELPENVELCASLRQGSLRNPILLVFLIPA